MIPTPVTPSTLTLTPQPPSNITVIPVSSTELNVTWNDEEVPLNFTVTSYEVKYTQVNNIHKDQTQARTSRVTLPPSSSSILLDGLRKYTRYNVSVRTLTSEGESPFSTPVATLTEEDGKKTRTETSSRP